MIPLVLVHVDLCVKPVPILCTSTSHTKRLLPHRVTVAGNNEPNCTRSLSEMSTVGEARPEEGNVEEEEDEPEFRFDVEEDPNRKDQLFSFRKEQPIATKDYRPSEQQLLQEGKLSSSEFSARLRKVVFSKHGGQPACLIVFRVDFATEKKGWFRFRNATVDAEFEEVGDDADSDDDEEEDEEYGGPLVCKFYPELIRGHIQTAAETYGLGFEVPISPPGVGAGISASWNITAPREGQHLIQGRLMGSPETKVRWTMNENEVSKGGIYEQPMFAVVVRHTHDRPFTMMLKIKATTYGGLPVTGKGGARIMFKAASAYQDSGKKAAKATSRLAGGSFEVGNQQWTSAAAGCVLPADLDEMDLEFQTQMRSMLLSQQGPGAGPSIFGPPVMLS